MKLHELGNTDNELTKTIFVATKFEQDKANSSTCNIFFLNNNYPAKGNEEIHKIVQ